jgi:hypothetical protein
MKIAHRFAWYLGGFGIGLILLFFFLSGKKTSCDYGPDARVMKNIRIKERIYSEEALNALFNHNLDTVAISSLLRSGDVNFGESNTDLDSCKQYLIEGTVNEKELSVLFENCDSTARVIQLTVK